MILCQLMMMWCPDKVREKKLRQEEAVLGELKMKYEC